MPSPRANLVARSALAAALLLGAATPTARAQQQPPPPPPAQDGPPGLGGFGGPGGPGGPGGFRGPGGPGPMMQQVRKILSQYDTDKNGWLNNDERKVAREALKKNPQPQRRFGGPGGMRGNAEPPKPGPRLSPGDVQNYPNAPLYDPSILRTIFIEFENPDWEAELVDFHKTDVDVPATLTVDGKRYPNVGIHFRGMSSYMMVGNGSKRSLNLSMDLADSKQRLYGYKSLNLLNSHEDPTFMHAVLYSQACRDYIPAPNANLVRVVINGENWGVYQNVQQFDTLFTKEWFGTSKGTRWKVPGSPRGGGGLVYSGDDLAEYKRHFEIKGKDDDKAWRRLAQLCKTLNQTPPDKLEAALEPMLDIDGVLWFLALDNALVNGDGYWVRDSDFSIYLDPEHRFHIIPADMNETFTVGGGPGGPRGGMGRGGFPGGPNRPGQPGQPNNPGQPGQPGQPGGPGGPGGPPDQPRAGGPEGGNFRPGGFGQGGPGGPGGFRGGPPMGGRIDLDPMVAMDDPRKPLRSKLLAVPALRDRYLQYVRTVTEQQLDWSKLAPIVARNRALIEKDVETDTRKLESFEAFKAALSPDPAAPRPQGAEPAPRGPLSLRAFVEQRRAYLLARPEVRKTQARADTDRRN